MWKTFTPESLEELLPAKSFGQDLVNRSFAGGGIKIRKFEATNSLK